MVHIPDLILVDVDEEANELINTNIEIVLAQGDKGHEQRVLLLDLVNQHNLGPGFPEGVEHQGGGYGSKEEYVQDNERDEEHIIPVVSTNSHQLVIGVRVVGRQGVHYEDCLIQLPVVTRKLVHFCFPGQLDYLVGNYCEENDYSCVEK